MKDADLPKILEVVPEKREVNIVCREGEKFVGE